MLAFGFDLPLAHSVPPSLWHAHEMLIGAFGAALIGFLTTAAPERTDTEPPRDRPLWVLAGLWGIGRALGLFGWDGMGAIGALADLAWMVALIVFLLRLSWQRRTDRLLASAGWLVLLMACTAAARWGFLTGDIALAGHALECVGLVFLGLLGLALARITVPVTNLVLDPSEATSPFRPHPGRLNLAPGLVLVALAADVGGLSPMVCAFLLFGAGAAFMDRVGEVFIGREAFRAEVLMRAGASALASGGLMLTGAARMSAPWDPVSGLHVALMGGTRRLRRLLHRRAAAYGEHAGPDARRALGRAGADCSGSPARRARHRLDPARTDSRPLGDPLGRRVPRLDLSLVVGIQPHEPRGDKRCTFL